MKVILYIQFERLKDCPLDKLMNAFCKYQNISYSVEISDIPLKITKGCYPVLIYFNEKIFDNFFRFIDEVEKTGYVLC